MHAESVDGNEADASRLRGTRHVVDEQSAALWDADAVRVLLVVREQHVAGELHLVRMRALGDGDLAKDARA